MEKAPPYLCHPLLQSEDIQHGFFTRHGGYSTGLYESLNGGLGSDDDMTAVKKNRHLAASALGGSGGDICGLFQIHSAVVHDAEPAAPRPEGDGLVTSRPGMTLTILTADCAPVLMLDQDTRMIAACHAGWRGAVAGITDATIDHMVSCGASRDHIKAVIGPTISRQSYQVGAELKDAVLVASPWAGLCFSEDEKPDRYRFDLTGYLLQRLDHAGVESAALGLDTYADGRFFSHRQATHQALPDSGRLISMIRRSA